MGKKYEKDSLVGERVHHNVDVLLAKKGWKVGHLMDLLGIENSPSYYGWFQGPRGPSDAQLHRLADALDVEISALLNEVE